MFFKHKLLSTTLIFALTVPSILIGQTGQPEVLVVSGRPTDDLGIDGYHLAFMYNFSLSPQGTWWVGEFELGNSVDAVHLRGNGNALLNIIWKEGDALPGLAGTFNSISDDRQTAINNDGVVFGLARRNLNGVISALAYQFDGKEIEIVAIQDEQIQALPTALYDNVLHSPNVSMIGTGAFVAENITLSGQVIDEDEISLLSNGNLLGGQRKGVTSYEGELLQNFNDERYFTNENGFFLFDGNTNGPAASNEIVVFGELGTAGDVLLKEDTTPIILPNGDVEPFDRADQVYLAGNNDWYVLGDTNGVGGATEVAIRNGIVLNAEGDASPDGFVYAQPIALSGDANGNFVWIWETSNPDLDRDTILVYNGEQLLLSEGDTIMVDYDHDGIEEPAVIEFLNLDARNVAVGGGYVYLMVEIDEPDTTFIGNAFIRIPVFVAGDINRDGDVNLLDVQPFVELLSSGQFQIEADLNGDGQVDLLDVSPFIELLTN